MVSAANDRDQPDDRPEGWREDRDRLLHELVGDPNAVKFLIDLSTATEVMDDFVDRDREIVRGAAKALPATVWFEIDCNPFYAAYKAWLHPLIVAATLTWDVSTEVEDGHRRTPQSRERLALAYVGRSGLYQIILTTILLTKGYEAARKAGLPVWDLLTFKTCEEYEAGIAKLGGDG